MTHACLQPPAPRLPFVASLAVAVIIALAATGYLGVAPT